MHARHDIGQRRSQVYAPAVRDEDGARRRVSEWETDAEPATTGRPIWLLAPVAGVLSYFLIIGSANAGRTLVTMVAAAAVIAAGLVALRIAAVNPERYGSMLPHPPDPTVVKPEPAYRRPAIVLGSALNVLDLVAAWIRRDVPSTWIAWLIYILFTIAWWGVSIWILEAIARLAVHAWALVRRRSPVA